MASPNSNTQNLFYTAKYNAKLIRTNAAHDELEAIREIAEQLPELCIQEMLNSWSIEDVEMSASDLFDHLMARFDWSEEPEALSAAPAVSAPVLFNRKNLKSLVSSGSIFNVRFIKRTTGELRSMTCRRGVTKGQKGGAKAFSDADKGLLTVFDMQAKGYRSIPVDAIQRLSVNGQVFNFAEAA